MGILIEERGDTQKYRTYGRGVCETCQTTSRWFKLSNDFPEVDACAALDKAGWGVSEFVVSMFEGHRAWCPNCKSAENESP